MVSKEKSHELASHGFSHMLLQADLITESEFLREMELIKFVSKLKGKEFKTFIYPRNMTGYINQLKNSGFIGYRGMPKQFPKPISKINNLLTELNIYDRAQQPTFESRPTLPICIPSGHFLNWRTGLRKSIPITISIKKYTHIIQDAIKNNRVLHLWTHPHNFVTGDLMFTLLDKILAQVGSAVKRGDMINYTQKEYAEHILAKKHSC